MNSTERDALVSAVVDELEARGLNLGGLLLDVSRARLQLEQVNDTLYRVERAIYSAAEREEAATRHG